MTSTVLRSSPRRVLKSRGRFYVEMSDSDDGNDSVPRHQGNRRGGAETELVTESKTESASINEMKSIFNGGAHAPGKSVGSVGQSRSREQTLKKQNKKNTGSLRTDTTARKRPVHSKRRQGNDLTRAAESQSKSKAKSKSKVLKVIAPNNENDAVYKATAKAQAKTNIAAAKQADAEIDRKVKLSNGCINRLAGKAGVTGIKAEMYVELRQYSNVVLGELLVDVVGAYLGDRSPVPLTTESIRAALVKNGLASGSIAAKSDEAAKRLLIKEAVMGRLLAFVAQHHNPIINVDTVDGSIPKDVLTILRDALQQHLISKMSDSFRFTKHAHRQTLSSEDFKQSMHPCSITIKAPVTKNRVAK